MVPGVTCRLAAMVMALTLVMARGDLYDDYIIEDLYNRLNKLDRDYGYIPENGVSDWKNDIMLDSHDSNGPESDVIRDQEYLEHGSNKDGWQKISGGAGEGQQHLTPDGTQNNTAEVKSDESLPFYCHPPNPCPKGFTAKDGCQEHVKDTASAQKKWIGGMQNKGLCACDTEHMFECPDDGKTVSQESDDETRDALNVVLDSFLENYKEDPSPYSNGAKRASLVAKKAPIVKRSVIGL